VKTIRMPKENLDAWLTALRSGNFAQGRRALLDEVTGGYCCLGVLEHCLTGEIERHPDGSPKEYPSESWLADQQITFFDDDGKVTTNPVVFFDGDDTRAAILNDAGVSFSVIANLIEEHTETF
jgi:hypothetical protein